MYLDVEISLYQVSKTLFNVTVRFFTEDGTEVRRKEWERLSWSTAVNMAHAAYLATKGIQNAKSARESNDGDTPFQEELPF